MADDIFLKGFYENGLTELHFDKNKAYCVCRRRRCYDNETGALFVSCNIMYSTLSSTIKSLN